MTDRDAVYLPKPQEILVVRGAVEARTVMWNLQVTESRWLSSPQPYPIELTGRIVGAEFYSGLDFRIANQKASIDRLLDHLRHHCPDLRPQSGDREVCGWPGKNGSDTPPE